MLKFEKTDLEGVLLIKTESFEDFRGEYLEIYSEKLYSDIFLKELKKDIKFIEDDISITMKHCLKGIHGDNKTWKLISCLYGKFYIVVLNYNKDSAQYGQWQGFTLSDKNHWQLVIPPKFGNGHVALSDMSIFHYKQSEYYTNSHNQFTIKYNDERFNIFWPVKNPILSQRDEVSKEKEID